MKSRKKITRIQLETDAKEDYLLLGLVSAEPQYKLSLAINSKLKISLKHKSPLEVITENGNSHHFSRFSDNSSGNGITFNLLSNKTGNEFLVKKLKKIDYLLQIYSPDNFYNIEHFTVLLRTVVPITAVFPIDPDETRDRNLQYLIP